MAKLTPKRKPILRIVLLCIAAIPVLFILYLILATLLDPVFNNIDKAKFEKLDTQSRALYEQVKSVSGSNEDWLYKASCEAELSGDWPTDEFTCTTRISTEKSVTSVSELNALHDKYYPVIDGSTMLKQKTALDKQYPGEFGVKFVGSSAEKKYVAPEGDFKCTYLANLSDGRNSMYGIELSIDKAEVSVSLRCVGIARGNWYS